MRFDFSGLPLISKAFSEKPMAFCEPGSVGFMRDIMELIAIETASRKARERWQATQLRNLLKHSAAKSAFWKQRIGARSADNIELSSLPALTRDQVREQVKSEGALIPANSMEVRKHATSGSTGVPVEFFTSQFNSQYNQVRSTAQYFLEGRDLSLNKVRMRPKPVSAKNGISVDRSDRWLNSLGAFVKSGTNRYIEYFHPNWTLLRKELEAEPVGYLIAQNSMVETMLQRFGRAFFERAGVAMWIPIAEGVDQELREMFASLDIPIRATYSTEEVGMIGSECEKVPGHYHVATSNVIVEVDESERIAIGEKQLGRVLVTHLHSYGTPFIRYDIGDLASLSGCCPCGHDGPVLWNIVGRSKGLVKHADGRLSIFYVRGQELQDLAKFDEYRIRQVDVKTILVEIGRATSLSPGEVAALGGLIKSHAGDDIEVEVRQVARIEWGHSVKRLAFRSEVT